MSQSTSMTVVRTCSQVRYIARRWEVLISTLPSRVEGTDVVANGEAEVGDGYDDGDLVPGDQQSHQAGLEHVGGEEGEKHDDEREHKTNILDPENLIPL